MQSGPDDRHHVESMVFVDRYNFALVQNWGPRGSEPCWSRRTFTVRSAAPWSQAAGGPDLAVPWTLGINGTPAVGNIDCYIGE